MFIFIQELKSPRKRANDNSQLESPSKRCPKDPGPAASNNDSRNSSMTDSPRPRVSKFSLKKSTLSR